MKTDKPTKRFQIQQVSREKGEESDKDRKWKVKRDTEVEVLEGIIWCQRLSAVETASKTTEVIFSGFAEGPFRPLCSVTSEWKHFSTESLSVIVLEGYTRI